MADHRQPPPTIQKATYLPRRLLQTPWSTHLPPPKL
ncbi:hypothetical protein LINPERPRIM_LOCUS6143 [Linum perenne]